MLRSLVGSEMCIRDSTEVAAWDDPDSDEVYEYTWVSKEFDLYKFMTPVRVRVDALPAEGIDYDKTTPLLEITIESSRDSGDETESYVKKVPPKKVRFDGRYGGIKTIEGMEPVRFITITIKPYFLGRHFLHITLSLITAVSTAFNGNLQQWCGFITVSYTHLTLPTKA